MTYTCGMQGSITGLGKPGHFGRTRESTQVAGVVVLGIVFILTLGSGMGVPLGCGCQRVRIRGRACYPESAAG